MSMKETDEKKSGDEMNITVKCIRKHLLKCIAS